MSALITKVSSEVRAAEVQTARIGLLGCGTIGAEVARTLRASRRSIRQQFGIDLELCRILVRDAARPRDFDSCLLTSNFEDLINDAPDLIIEAIGGVDPALNFVHRALAQGISVVTANKSLIARHGAELREAAHRSGAALRHESAVGAAVPILATLQCLRGDRVQRISAVINGTCNYILSRMSEVRCTYDQALQDAVKLGYAEPNPEADVSGLDSAEKLCVLAAEIGFRIDPDDVERRGIQSISLADIDAARRHGCVIKLIAELSIQESACHARAIPMLVPRKHPLARASGAQNAVIIETQHAGELTLQGEGAGAKPTTSAIIGDVLRALNGKTAPAFTSALTTNRSAQLRRMLALAGAVEPRSTDRFSGTNPGRLA